METNKWIIIIYIGIAHSFCDVYSSYAQSYIVEEYKHFRGGTNDRLFLDGGKKMILVPTLSGNGCYDTIYSEVTEYMLVKSPMSFFQKYDTVYAQYGMCHTNRFLPIVDDKNYELTWYIRDSMLLLCDMNSACMDIQSNLEGQKNSDRLVALENLTKHKFTVAPFKVPCYWGELQDNKPIMYATWVSDTFYIKRFPERGEFYLSENFETEPFQCITINKGKIIKSETVDKMYIKRAKPDWTSNISNNNAKAKLREITFPKGFKGNTNDFVFYYGLKNMCNESPASSLKGYNELYGKGLACKRDIMLPIKDDKKYEFVWLIHNFELYLCDVNFFCLQDTAKNNDLGKFDAVEKLTDQKMIDLPNSIDDVFLNERVRSYISERGVIAATWFSDTLYIKMYKLPDEGYYGSKEEKMPFERIVFKNGKISSRIIYGKDTEKDVSLVKEMP
jgi:hypothetical protein